MYGIQARLQMDSGSGRPLRAFDQDKARLKTKGGNPFVRWPAGVGRSRTLDEILLEHASPYGPVIAIGDPRDPIPPLGAARFYVEGDEWQDAVRGLVGACQVAIICPNRSEGIQWELELVKQLGGRLQVIFLASPEIDREATIGLLNHMIRNWSQIPDNQTPVAAYQVDGVWQVLTAKRHSVDSYTVALNAALQNKFGLNGVPLVKVRAT